MRLRSKAQLIEFMSGAQVLLMVIALLVFGGWIQSRVGQIIRAQIVAENQLIAQQMARLLRTMPSGNLVFGDATWGKFQAIIEETKLPNDGYLCIADASSGQLLCHPQIRKEPALRASKLDNLMAMRDDSKSFNLFRTAVESPGEGDAFTGIAGRKGAQEVVSAASLPNIDGVLFVHQSEASTRSAVQRILTPLGYAGVIIGSILIFVSTKLSSKIVSGFEHQLEVINTGLEETVKHRTTSLMKTRNAVIFGLAKLAESRDSDTGEHLERISLFSTLLAKAHAEVSDEITVECIESIGLASSLHDIGKVGVPDRVLLKAGKLTQEERREIEVHPRIGADCLNAIDDKLEGDGFLSLAREICAYHHEKWDGSGYPYGLQGEQIPLPARIVAVADVYDALRSKRPYKNPFSHEATCKILAEGAGSHFDPAVISSFIKVHREFESISDGFLNRKELNSSSRTPLVALECVPLANASSLATL